MATAAIGIKSKLGKTDKAISIASFGNQDYRIIRSIYLVFFSKDFTRERKKKKNWRVPIKWFKIKNNSFKISPVCITLVIFWSVQQ